jgi:hypothetical protein
MITAIVAISLIRQLKTSTGQIRNADDAERCDSKTQ